LIIERPTPTPCVALEGLQVVEAATLVVMLELTGGGAHGIGEVTLRDDNSGAVRRLASGGDKRVCLIDRFEDAVGAESAKADVSGGLSASF
jgi:hypothetical protein